MSMVNVAGNTATTKVSNIDDDMIQPNAVDIRLDKVFEISSNLFVIDAENNKQHRGSTELQPDEEGFFYLEPNKMYEYVSSNGIKVGPDEAGWVIGRSSLMRNSVQILSCLYDSGYHGSIMGTIMVYNGPAKIQKGTRIGQYLSFKAESLKAYDGSYGYGKEYDKKYGTTAESQNLK